VPAPPATSAAIISIFTRNLADGALYSGQDDLIPESFQQNHSKLAPNYVGAK
jgi:hypothetical protein